MKVKIAFWITTLLLFAAVAYISVTTVIQPVFTKNPLPKAIIRSNPEERKKVGKDEIIVPDDDTIQSSETGGNTKDAGNKLLEIRRKEILLRSRLTLATEDSTYLVLDLINNKAILELKGIPLHECRILRADISNSIKLYPADALLNWLAEPFVLRNVEATIPKISFVEKIAPKDTLEANKMVTEPKEAKLGDVFVVMDFDRNLRLVMSQSEQPDLDGLKLISDLRRKYSKLEISRSLKALTKFNREPVKPQIEIVIPKSDATILYKALPLNPRMILRM